MNLSSLLAVARSVCLKAALWLMFMIFIGSCVQPQSKKPAKTDAKGPVETGGNGPVVFGAIKINEPVGEAYETFDPNAPDKIYNTPEEMAEFPGGYGKLNSFLNKHIVYPETAKENHVEGKVFITFVVEKNGTLSNINVIRFIGSGCDQEAVRVIKTMPKWKPGKKEGHIVREQYTIPVQFSLTDAKSKTSSKGSNQIEKLLTMMGDGPNAEFIGGQEALYRYLAENIRYPKAASETDVEGKVYLSFVVEKDGAINHIKVLKGIGHGCDKEAVRVLKASPKWKPARLNGRPVSQQYTLPVHFAMSAS